MATQIGPASAQPFVLASPTCGPPNFTTTLNANGFEPESSVAWKVVDANQTVPLYGYYSTNAGGGFIETLPLDDIPEGHYTIYFGIDVNNDGKFDLPSSTVVEIEIPCPDLAPQAQPSGIGNTSASSAN